MSPSPEYGLNVYDFDKTIYVRDSTADFYRFCLRRWPRTLLTLPRLGWTLAPMLLGLRAPTRAKEGFYRFLRHVPPEAPVLFWQTHMDGIQPWYLRQKRPDDIIVSASPEFLLRPVAEKLGFFLIGSRVSQSDGKTTGLNCHDEEKVRRFRELYPDAHIDEFYSDSLSDTPLARLADRAWLVKDGTPVPWRVL